MTEFNDSANADGHSSARRSIHEGFIDVDGHPIWYRTIGDGEEPGKQPLLCLHGGPGVSCDYLEPLEAVANSGRRVLFYDQLGCGRSDHPHDPSLWTMNHYLRELSTLRTALGLDRLHILGQSWGGMLALEYTLAQASGIRKCIRPCGDPANSVLQVI